VASGACLYTLSVRAVGRVSTARAEGEGATTGVGIELITSDILMQTFLDNLLRIAVIIGA
jgi:hypothetical protein